MSRFQRYVDEFAKLMVEKLEKNAHKGEWQDTSDDQFFEMLGAELMELRYAISNPDLHNVGDVLREAADVANFALMLASNALRRQGKDLIEEPVYTFHGQWTVMNEIRGMMYSDQWGGIYYEDNEFSRGSGLSILPEGAKIHPTD
jgi:hypothetical protein